MKYVIILEKARKQEKLYIIKYCRYNRASKIG